MARRRVPAKREKSCKSLLEGELSPQPHRPPTRWQLSNGAKFPFGKRTRPLSQSISRQRSSKRLTLSTLGQRAPLQQTKSSSKPSSQSGVNAKEGVLREAPGTGRSSKLFSLHSWTETRGKRGLTTDMTVEEMHPTTDRSSLHTRQDNKIMVEVEVSALLLATSRRDSAMIAIQRQSIAKFHSQAPSQLEPLKPKYPKKKPK